MHPQASGSGQHAGPMPLQLALLSGDNRHCQPAGRTALVAILWEQLLEAQLVHAKCWQLLCTSVRLAAADATALTTITVITTATSSMSGQQVPSKVLPGSPPILHGPQQLQKVLDF